MKEEIQNYFMQLQDAICEALEQTDGGTKFIEDAWQREGGGGGRTRVIANGNIIEKGGVNFSAVHGKTPAKILEALSLPESNFFATGVSIVIHPSNPFVPIIHMNVRYFEMSNGTYWFGGGIDLTPHYVLDDDARWFHQQLNNACDKHDLGYYPKFKTWADDYFYIPHRKETRGIGGIFFDHLKETGNISKQQLFDFVTNAKKAGKTIACYGAPAKGNTLLNYCGITANLINFTVDKNPHKQNCFLPGSHIPIFAVNKIFQEKPDYLLILPWNLKDEIIESMAEIRSWGGKFVIPIPELEVY